MHHSTDRITDTIALVGMNYQGRLKEGRKDIFYLTTHSTHFFYDYMASDIW